MLALSRHHEQRAPLLRYTYVDAVAIKFSQISCTERDHRRSDPLDRAARAFEMLALTYAR
jgi:hypothetical protein